MSELFGPLSSAEPFRVALGDRAVLDALIEAEAALARAEARCGVIPSDAAVAITAACRPGTLDPTTIGHAAVPAGNVVIPLVRQLTALVGEPHGRWVHWGATSQDISDTAFSLVLRQSSGLVSAALEAAADACAAMARRHRTTPMVARTLLQQALPTTFGLRAAGWLTALDSARAQLEDARRGLAVQLGGAAGTLASLGHDGPEVLAAYASELDLAEPVLPWHSDRTRFVTLASALGLSAGSLAKVAGDLLLLSQTEIGEVAEAAAAGRGGSSTLPHKRNPVGSVSVVAATRRATALAGLIGSTMDHEHERAAGNWQTEWEVLPELVRLVGGAATALAEVLTTLEVHPDRMAANLESGDGFLMAESVQSALAPHLGRQAAHDVVEAACHRALDSGASLAASLAETPEIVAVLSEAALRAALDPAGYLGAAPRLVDRALDARR